MKVDIDTRLACLLLGCTSKTLRVHAARGEIPGARREGVRWRYDLETLLTELPGTRGMVIVGSSSPSLWKDGRKSSRHGFLDSSKRDQEIAVEPEVAEMVHTAWKDAAEECGGNQGYREMAISFCCTCAGALFMLLILLMMAPSS